MTGSGGGQRLSKSRYTAGLQCLKQLWWRVHEPDAPELVADEGLQAIFTRGQKVGELARAQVPGGVLIDLPHYDFEGRVAATARALADGAPAKTPSDDLRGRGPTHRGPSPPELGSRALLVRCVAYLIHVHLARQDGIPKSSLPTRPPAQRAAPQRTPNPLGAHAITGNAFTCSHLHDVQRPSLFFLDTHRNIYNA